VHNFVHSGARERGACCGKVCAKFVLASNDFRFSIENQRVALQHLKSSL
jgi:hypothetical protein